MNMTDNTDYLQQREHTRGWAWSQPVTPTNLLVLLAFVDYCDDLDADARNTITECTGLAKSTVNRALRDLQADGLLIRLDEDDAGRMVSRFEFNRMLAQHRSQIEEQNRRLAALEKLQEAAGVANA